MTRESKPAGRFNLQIEQVSGYEMRVRFDKAEYPDLTVDEPPPLGKSVGPNPARLLAASIGSCLSASLVYCLGRAGIEPNELRAEIDTELVRNENNRLRIGSISVRLSPSLEDGAAQLDQCLAVFEDFCTVTASVRDGIDIRVLVEPRVGATQ